MTVCEAESAGMCVVLLVMVMSVNLDRVVALCVLMA
jgi:hypothetical protein